MEKTIDADGHVLEHWSAWDGLPDQHRPRVVTDERGLDHVIVADREVFVARLGQMGTPGTDVGVPGPAVPLEEARRGAFDPVARLADMDAEGIDVAVLYPTIGLGFWGITDTAAAVAVARAYNDWLAALLRAAPTVSTPRRWCPSRIRPPPWPSCAGPGRSSDSSPRSSAPTRASAARWSTRPTSRSGRRRRTSAWPSPCTKACRWRCRRSDRIATRPTCWCSTPSLTPSSRCSPARS